MATAPHSTGQGGPSRPGGPSGREAPRRFRWALASVAILLAILLLSLLLLALFQRRLVYLPDPILHDTPASVGLSYEDIRFHASDGTELDGWYISAPGARATVLLCHGNAGNISTRLPAISALHELGVNLFLFDYRGYGASGGTPSEQGTYRDGEAAWQWIADHSQITGGAPVIVMGRSLGGAIAARLARRHRVAGLILEAAFPSIPKLLDARVPFLPLELVAAFRYDTERDLKEVSCPVLVAHSRADRVVPFRLGRELYDRAREPKSFIELRGPHDTGFSSDRRRYLGALEAFINEAVGTAGDKTMGSVGSGAAVVGRAKSGYTGAALPAGTAASSLTMPFERGGREL
ncbi:MAG TPA: alpha/beta hydrolase [Spirochaetia bacterium]|nr:alpha/beta hydrolase [Spirochaetia bacterium]